MSTSPYGAVLRTSHIIQAAKRPDFLAHSRAFYFACVEAEFVASESTQRAWGNLLKLALASHGPYSTKPMGKKFLLLVEKTIRSVYYAYTILDSFIK